MAQLFNLSNKKIRKIKPGFSENYYKIVENLDNYFTTIVDRLNVEVVYAKRLAGETNINIYFETIPEEKLILRISPWRNELLTSSIFFDLLVENKIPSPEVIKYDTTLEIVPFEYQIITFIEHDQTYSDKDVERMGNVYGKVLRKIHLIKTRGFGQPKSKNAWINASWGEALQRAYLQSKFLEVKNSIYSKAKIAEIESFFTNNNLAISQPFLIHSDVGINNVLFRIGKSSIEVAAVIDSGSLISGDPLFDIAMLINDDDKFSNATIDSYGLSDLSQKKKFRLKILRLLCSYWTSCYLSTVKEDPKKYTELTRSLLINLNKY
ncbi:MAG: aminoglycoside phosphotransferase family protein [Patescibacteria group bacterium]|nr:aminoglycoside phosphotransferase family protein [Patescibacteria group bacterium]